MLGRWIIGALAISAVAFAGVAMVAIQRVGSLSDEVASLKRNALVIERAAAEDSRARGVAQREADRWQLQSRKYQTALAELTKGIDDVEIDGALQLRINRMLRGE
jgi:hypothetical protein